MALAISLLTIVLIDIFATQPAGARVAASPSVSLNAATCSLTVRGKNLAVRGPAYDADSKLLDQGLKEIRLACSTVPLGQQVPISVNRTWISTGHISGFKGVTVLPGDACLRATTAQTQIFGLITFCGSFDLTLSLVDISGVHIHSPITTGVDNAIAWGFAAVLLGRNVRATVERARIMRNSVLSVFAVKDSASLLLQRDVVMMHNRGVWGSCVHAMGSSSVVVNGSQMSHNFAHNSGGSITGREQSSVLVTGGAVISYCECRVWGGAVQADGSVNFTVAGGSVIHNNKAQYGGAGACKSTSVLHVKGPHTTLHSNTAQIGGGGIAAQGFATILSTNGAIWRNNSGQSGGAAAGQNNVNITFDSNSLATENHAQYGGVAAIADTGFIVFKGNTTLMHNRAEYKGAGTYGGVAAAQGQSTIYFYYANVLSNTAGSGGVVALQNLCHMKAYKGSIFSGNRAEQQGGVACAMELSDVVFNGSQAINNSAPGGLGGVVALESRTTAVLAGSTIMANNSAANGGAIAMTTQASLRLEGTIVLAYNQASGDGGAAYLGPGTGLSISLSVQGQANGTRGPRIIRNTAGGKGGGVLFDGDVAKLDKALRAIAMDNNATFDPDISTPLQRIDIVGDTFVQLASRRNRTDTVSITVKLGGHLGVASGGVRVQATLEGMEAAGVLAAENSDIQGIAVLRNVKLRVKPGNHTVLISAPDARNIAPAKVIVDVRTCIIGETTNELGDSCDTCGPGTYSLDPTNFTCDSCPQSAICQGGAQIVPDVGMWSSSQMSPQVHPCPNPSACSGDRRSLLSCEVVPAVGSNNNSVTTIAFTSMLQGGVGDARSFAFRCKTNVSNVSLTGSSDRTQPRRGMLSTMDEGTVYLTQADTRAMLCSEGYSGNLCANCQPGYGQATAFTCHPCLNRRAAAVLYAAAFIAALLLVRLLAWLTVINNNAPAATTKAATSTSATTTTTTATATATAAVAAAAATTAHAPNTALAQPAPSKAKDPGAQLSSDCGCVSGWGLCLPKLCTCCSTKSSTADGSCSIEAVLPSPHAAQTASTAGLSTVFSSSQPLQSSVGMQSTNAPGTLKSVSSMGGQGSAQGGGSYLAHASDIFRVLVLYIQYMVIIANLRVSWPLTLSDPSKALAWLYSVGSSQALALECLYDMRGWSTPPGVQRQLIYILMPLAVFLVLWLVELLVRCLILVVPFLMSSCMACTYSRPARGGNSRGSSGAGATIRHQASMSTTKKTGPCRPVFLHFGTSTLVLFMVTIFFFLPALLRAGLGFFACIPLDDPNAIPYAWAALAPGSYWVGWPDQPCWSGWHAKWAWSFGAPLVGILCVVIPIGIAVLVHINRERLDSPELKRHFGFLYRQYKPNRAAWEAVVIGQTTLLCVVAVFGLALGPHYQTLTMAAFCAVNIVMLLAFEPYKHRQQHRVQLFAFTCIFVMCFAALSFIPSFDGKVPPEAYKITMGAAVLILNVVFICWALWQLKLCVVAEFRSFWSGMSSKASVVMKKTRLFVARKCTTVQARFARALTRSQPSVSSRPSV